MAKEKRPKGEKRLTHKHLHSRVSYLHQAAVYLGAAGEGQKPIQTSLPENEPSRDDAALTSHQVAKPESKQSRHFMTHLRSISLRSQVRLTPAMKRIFCKRCDSLLIAGRTSSERVENASRGGFKTWADVLVIECHLCGTKKRFPTGAKQAQNGSSTSDKLEAQPPQQMETHHTDPPQPPTVDKAIDV